ncbi:hypothetical protein LAG90_03095 [Marinilongibacter aquaticus]|uniref:LVIVD repeat-containing protein n=1 Tax=Marinilongibacter aquaticus TaxID=2975157 RepID=UPI0021BD8917|nr:hypothetical protein [Marinilongibacter aquaticus]UBM59637.1 hypothetical protein LAG90_03095 [Marinilongibacter aquaticus]
MKTSLRQIGILIGLLVCTASCTDDCESTRTYRKMVYEQLSVEQIRNGIQTVGARTLEDPAKIYVNGNYIFISEAKKGLHVIDNTNPSSPQAVSFVEVPGILDMAVKDNMMYVDSYVDLVVLDISDPQQIHEVGRVENRFTSGAFGGLYWAYDPYTKMVQDSHYETVTETIKTNCGEGGYYNGCCYAYDMFDGMNGAPGASNGSSGKGGSMARFTIDKNYLYTVSGNALTLYDLENETQPDSAFNVDLGWGIETIFPYRDKLFIGSNSGMHIYDNSDPANPKRLSVFQHARACDPVVVHENLAYVTLRDGSACGAAPNRLDVVDISNAANPSLLKSYDMENPNGLSVHFPNLFICEGEYGLKSLDAQNASDIKTLEFIEDFYGFDCIALEGNVLLVIGKDGLYQFDYSDPANLKQLSVIPVKFN